MRGPMGCGYDAAGDLPRRLARSPLLEQCGAFHRNRWHDQRAIQIEIPLLAARLGDQEAAMARRTRQRALISLAERAMLGADRIT